MRLKTPRRGTDEYVGMILSTNYYTSGDWFPAQYVAQTLTQSGFVTTTNKVLFICNELVLDGLLDKMMEDENGQNRRCFYRQRVSGREWLTKKWREHSNEELEVEQCCLFPA